MANLVNNLGGTLGFGENYLTRNDDSYQPGVNLAGVFGGALNFFGTSYQYVSINNNGNVTFANSASSGLETYTPFGLANGGHPIIAPFFADVDTLLANGLPAANQVTPTAGGTSRGSDLVWYDLDGTGYGTLTVTWDDVGYYSSNTDKLNAFQLQLVGTGGGNFDVVFRYENINWTTGDYSGGSGGLGGTIARAGYSTGDGASWYELPQSSDQDGMLELETTPGNTGVAGYYRFAVRSGSDAAETLNGTADDDLLAGAGGDDVLNGYGGADVLIGNAGADTMRGGAGDDTYVTDGSDTLVEAAGAGTDTVMSGASCTLGSTFENLYLSGSAAINATGNGLANVLRGNAGNNVLNGGAGADTVDYSLATAAITVDLQLTTAQSIASQGSDTLVSIENVIGSNSADTLYGTAGANVIRGGLGNDTMAGRGGDDTYWVDSSSDVITEASGGGRDIAWVTASYVLPVEAEDIVLFTAAALDATGNGGANVIYAGAGNNVMDGAAGRDTVSYFYAHAGVRVSLGTTAAQATGGSGSDTLRNVENLAGTTYDDTLLGSTAANRLAGDSGADVLDGRGGADTMEGGAGNDTYYVDTSTDVVVEGGAGGRDLVRTTASFTLSANVEYLRQDGTADIDATGNALANTIEAGSGDNVLDGGAGTDTLGYGYATAGVTVSLSTTVAQATGGSGTDTVLDFENLQGSDFDDVLTGHGEANQLVGGKGRDSLDGRGGADTLVGGAGNDTYYVDSALDVVSETESSVRTGGYDTIVTRVSYTLVANVEHLRLNGSGSIDATGNALNNWLYSASGDNLIDGAGGVDTVSYGDASAGVHVSLALTGAQDTGGCGVDTLRNLENLSGSSYADWLAGNASANVLQGGGGHDALLGRAGNDRLDGGMGNDILTGGAGADLFVFSTAPGVVRNHDSITDFSVAEDTIGLDHAIFTRLAASGSLDATNFRIGAAAADSNDYVVYDAAEGGLYYDADGSGAGAQVLIGTLDAELALTAADFLLV